MLTETVMLPRSAAAAGPSAPDVEETPAEAAPEPDATACAEPPSEPAETDDLVSGRQPGRVALGGREGHVAQGREALGIDGIAARRRHDVGRRRVGRKGGRTRGVKRHDDPHDAGLVLRDPGDGCRDPAPVNPAGQRRGAPGRRVHARNRLAAVSLLDPNASRVHDDLDVLGERDVLPVAAQVAKRRKDVVAANGAP